jgi:hypothetical protein
MITRHEWLNPTRASGLVAYGTTVTCCGIAWIRIKVRRASHLAAVLMLIESLLLLDMAFNWRWKLHQELMNFAIQKHEYAPRRPPQLVVVSVLSCLLLFGLIVSWRSFRDRGTTSLAVSGVLLSLVVWCTEVVSLHVVDHVLYYSSGGVMAVSLLWILSCTMTSIGILLDPR